MRSKASKIAAALCVLPAIAIASAVPDLLEARTTSNITCYDGIFAIVSRGSEETQGQSVLETIATAIKAAIPNSGSDEVVYPALITFWDSAPTGATNLQQQMTDYHAACPDGKMVLLGYSQGCYVISTALAGGNYSDESWDPISSDIGDSIAAVVLFGDQSRVVGADFTVATGTNCEIPCTTTSPLKLTSPYNSNMAVYDDRLEEWCDEQDPICCSSGTNITAHLSYWSDNTTDTAVQFVQNLVGSAVNGSSTVSSSIASSTASSSAWSSTSSSATSYASSAALSSSIESSLASALSTALTSASGSTTESGTTTGSSTSGSLASTTGSGSAAASATAASTEPSAATPAASSSATSSTSDGRRTTDPTILATFGLVMCSVLFGMRLLA